MIIETQIYSAIIDMMDTTLYSEIRVSELVRRLGISRSSFYFYFDSIPDAVAKIEDDFIAGISDEHSAIMRIIVNKKNNQPHAELIYPTIQFVKNNLRTFRILSGPHGDPAFRTKLTERIYNIYNILYTSSSKTEIDKILTCEVMSSAQWTIYKWWANHETEVTPDDIVDYVSKLLIGLKVFF